MSVVSADVEPLAIVFEDDGIVPNNPMPFLVYKGAVAVANDHPEKTIERLFGANGWGDMWRNGIFDYLHYHATVHEALGIARGALDSFVDVAKNKIPRGKTSPLRDNSVVQTNLAQAEVGIRSARAFLLQSMADIWKEISAGDNLTVDHRIIIRMASTNAIHKAREAVDFAYNAAGATAIFESHPLERRFRDIHTVTQQLQGRLSHFETVGAWMMGADADLTFV